MQNYVYTASGNQLTETYNTSGTKLDKAYTSAGVEIPLQQQTDIFKDKNWCFVADSNWDVNNRNSYNSGQLYSDEYVASILTTANRYSKDTNNVKYAWGGRGMLSNKVHAYYEYNYQPDLDVVILQVSPNDWQYRNGAISTISSTEGNEQKYGTNATGVPNDTNNFKSITNPTGDVLSDNTIAGLINHTIATVHRQCPNAKIQIILGYVFPIDKASYNKSYKNVCALAQICVTDWLYKNIDNCQDWLMPAYPLLFDFNITHTGDTYVLNSYAYKRTSFITDKEPTYIWEGNEVPNQNYNYSLDPYKEFPEIFTTVPGVTDTLGFQKMYLPGNNSVSGGKWGHFGYLLHQHFYSPLIAHLLAKALAPDKSDAEINSLLPEQLQYNNI